MNGIPLFYINDVLVFYLKFDFVNKKTHRYRRLNFLLTFVHIVD